MASSRRLRSVSFPIILSVVSVGLSIALLVGWTLVMLRNAEFTKEVFQNTLLMVAGIVSIAVIMAVLVLFTVFLVREILELRRQTSFIDSVTHELKSPLASLKLCAETLARPQLDESGRHALQKMMVSDIARLSSVIDGILDASRVERSDRALAFQEIEVAQLVQESVRHACALAKLSPECIDVQVPDDLVMEADPHALRTIVDNLVSNAIKYSEDAQGIRVRMWAKEGRGVWLQVQDQGIGIAKEDLKRIFQRFYRAPEEMVRKRHGTGLGLFVVAAFVKDLGGSIEVRSPGLGQGSTIEIRFPRRIRISKASR